MAQWLRVTSSKASDVPGGVFAGLAVVAAVLAVSAALPAAGGEPSPGRWEPGDFGVISGPASPRVALAVRREGGRLLLAVDVEAARDREASVKVGLAADRTRVLGDKDAAVTRAHGATRFGFAVPEADLVAGGPGWGRLRLGVGVSWAGGPLGKPRQIEGLRQASRLAPHDGLSGDPADWLPLDLAEHQRAVDDRRSALAVDFLQSADGKATIVIEAEDGRRVRNLIAGRALPAGRHVVPWDGADEGGVTAPPGEYRWRAVAHPGVTPHHLFSFCDSDGSNHATFEAAAANREWTFFAARVTEGGHAFVALDARGDRRMGYNPAAGLGLDRVAIAADDRYLYAAHDGSKWGEHVDRTKPDWKTTHELALERFEIRGGGNADFGGGKRFVVLRTAAIGPGSPRGLPDRAGLAGMALVGGKLYVADVFSNALIVVDPGTGSKVGELKLHDPGPVAADGSKLLAASGGRFVRLDPASGATETVLPAGVVDPAGLAGDGAGRLYISDSGAGNVKVFDASGRRAGEVGKPGGAYAGAYEPARLIRPRGLVVAANGWLWVTEEDRWTPKRLAAFDPATGRVVRERFGPTSYGAPGAGFDDADHSRWVGLGTSWDVDFVARTAAPRALVGASGLTSSGGNPPALNYHYARQDGRTFVIGLGPVSAVFEQRPDRTLKPLAAVASLHRFAYAHDWNPPRAFVDAANRAYPALKYAPGRVMPKGPGMLWVDKDGDGAMQAGEFDFSTAADDFAGASWGNAFLDLTLRLPALVKGKAVIVTLKPDGYLPGGAPRYPSLNDACRAGTPIDLPADSVQVETAVDRSGVIVCNSDPVMRAFAPDGRTLWTYPNRWSGVHGSHAAPLPEPGVTQGTLFFLGMAPLDARSDVFVMNGNHGRFFVFTSDGFYLDEMFKDVRLGGTNDVSMIGGECFGGTFGRAEDGRYYLQAGGIEYRVFRIDGLDRVRRSGGPLTVSPAQALAAERERARRAAETSAPHVATVRVMPVPPTIDGKDHDWPAEPSARWDRSGRFPVSVRAGFDAVNLYLDYQVDDPSPWVNNGKDWQSLFKTGDAVLLDLGGDPAANPSRTVPVPGDLRLLVAPYQGGTVAVLYRHRLPGAADPVVFQSPWRSETVGSVAVLKGAKVAVAREGGRYRVEAAVPLADLGLSRPDGLHLRGDFGVIYGDDAGTIDTFRNHWSNQATGLVNDVPGEIMLAPALWGTLEFSER